MAEIKKFLFATSNKLPMCYFQFLDDIFKIWSSRHESLNYILNLATDFYSSIKFTTKTSSSEIHILDTTVHLKKRERSQNRNLQQAN